MQIFGNDGLEMKNFQVKSSDIYFGIFLVTKLERENIILFY